MGYGTTIMSIVLFVNLVIFIGALATDNSSITSPVISTLVSVYNGDLVSIIPNIASYIGSAGTIIGLIIISIVALSYATGSTALTGGGGYGATQTPMLIGIFIFTSLTLIPNFSVMGFPDHLDTVLYAIFGLMLAIGLYGIIRGE